MQKLLFIVFFIGIFTNANANPIFQKMDGILLKTGQLVPLTLDEDISAEAILPNNTIDFVARTNVKINGIIVIEKGAIAEGSVVRTENDLDGRINAVTVTLNWVQAVDSKTISLTSRKETFRFLYDESNKAIIKKGIHLSANVNEDILIAVENNQILNTIVETIEPIIAVKPKPIIDTVVFTKVKVDTIQTETLSILEKGTPIRLSTALKYEVNQFFVGKSIPLRCLKTVKSKDGKINFIDFGATAFAEVVEIIDSAFGQEVFLKVQSIQSNSGKTIALRGEIYLDVKDFNVLQEINVQVAADMEL
jgi:hypothetical protein